jgi:CDP-6-deoxy-D-xylo-4-hexulose-3-dehydrase
MYILMTDKDTEQVLYARATYGEEERKAVEDVLDDPKSLAGGDKTSSFEKEVSNIFGKEYGIMVNSGSSANLLAIECLDLPEGSDNTSTYIFNYCCTYSSK